MSDVAMYKSEIFRHEGDANAIVPGEQWSIAVMMARHEERRGLSKESQFARFGLALSGAVGVLDEVSVDLTDFAEAARPPLAEDERVQLERGYIIGSRLLGNTVGPHIPEMPEINVAEGATHV